MTEQAIEGGSFELLGGNITGKFIEVSWMENEDYQGSPLPVEQCLYGISNASDLTSASSGELRRNYHYKVLNVFISSQVTPFTKIVKEWRLKSWPAGTTSTVTISIKQSKEDTKILIKQSGVPVKEVNI